MKDTHTNINRCYRGYAIKCEQEYNNHIKLSKWFIQWEDSEKRGDYKEALGMFGE